MEAGESKAASLSSFELTKSSFAGLLFVQETRRRLHPVRILAHVLLLRSQGLPPSCRCANRQCYTAFHPTCAREYGLELKMKQGSAAGGDLRAYCDKHGEVSMLLL